jgi:hypothetical protein
MLAALTRPAVIQPRDHGVWLSLVTDRLIAELRANGIAEPLAERFTLAAVLSDLFALTEAPLPASVAALIGVPV